LSVASLPAVRLELVEGLPFFSKGKEQGFDRLSPNGFHGFDLFLSF